MRKGPLTSNAEVSKIPEQGSTFDAVTNIFRLARTIYMRCTYGVFGRAITKYTVINGVYILKRCVVSRVGQNHLYVAYIRHFWQGNHQKNSQTVYIH